MDCERVTMKRNYTVGKTALLNLVVEYARKYLEYRAKAENEPDRKQAVMHYAMADHYLRMQGTISQILNHETSLTYNLLPKEY